MNCVTDLDKVVLLLISVSFLIFYLFDEAILHGNFQDPEFSRFLESHDSGLKSSRNEDSVSYLRHFSTLQLISQ